MFGTFVDSRAENTETFLVQLDSRDSVIVTDDTSVVNIEDNDGKQAIIFSRIKPSLYGILPIYNHPCINLVMLTPFTQIHVYYNYYSRPWIE